jgi:hypothetical protein
MDSEEGLSKHGGRKTANGISGLNHGSLWIAIFPTSESIPSVMIQTGVIGKKVPSTYMTLDAISSGKWPPHLI